jgi:hypothetical protein
MWNDHKRQYRLLDGTPLLNVRKQQKTFPPSLTPDSRGVDITISCLDSELEVRHDMSRNMFLHLISAYLISLSLDRARMLFCSIGLSFFIVLAVSRWCGNKMDLRSFLYRYHCRFPIATYVAI